MISFTDVRDTLQRVAQVNGVAAPEIIVLPTALIITLPGIEEARTEVASTGESALRLDQVEAVFSVADAAERGELGPRDALVKLRSARTLPPSFGPAVIVGGHAVIAMGLAVILSGGWTEVGVAAVLGAGVGVIKRWAARRRLAIQVFLPVSFAFLVAVVVALLARTELDPAVLPPILGALVTFIPGGLLTTAVLELATGQMISGGGRSSTAACNWSCCRWASSAACSWSVNHAYLSCVRKGQGGLAVRNCLSSVSAGFGCERSDACGGRAPA